MKTAVLVSRCLLGEPCRYDGGDNRCAAVCRLSERYRLISVCPECDGGLPTPRLPSERVGERVLMCDGSDVTEAFALGAQSALRLAQANSIAFAVLKAKSPSCGKGEIYDGSFSRKTAKRSGVTAELLEKMGFTVLTEQDFPIEENS